MSSPRERLTVMKISTFDFDPLSLPKLGALPEFSTVHRLSPTTALKYGPSVRPAEAQLLQYLSRATSIPVPRVHSWARHPATGHWGIEMERVDRRGAVPLDAVYEELCGPAKADLARQLRRHLRQLRDGRRATWIGSFDGRLAGDRFLDLIASARGEAAPHSSEGEFLADVADAVTRRGPPRSVWSETVARLLRDLPRWRRRWRSSPPRSLEDESSSSSSLLSLSSPSSLLSFSSPSPSSSSSITTRRNWMIAAAAAAVVAVAGGGRESGGEFILTHADLTPEHILVRYDGRALEIVSIVGWGQAGYYPEYYEYVKMNFWDPESSFIGDRVADRVLEPRLAELSVFLHARDIIW